MAKIDRASITVAALELIEAGEPNGLTLSAIARRLDVTQPALYHHVGGIDDVLRWTGIAVRDQLQSELAAVTVGLSNADAVLAAAAAWRRFSREHPGLYKSTEWHPVEGDEDLEHAVGQVLAVLAATFRGFNLNDEQCANAALALRSALHGFCSFELGAGNPSPQSADESFDAVIMFLLSGIASLAPAG